MVFNIRVLKHCCEFNGENKTRPKIWNEIIQFSQVFVSYVFRKWLPVCWSPALQKTGNVSPQTVFITCSIPTGPVGIEHVHHVQRLVLNAVLLGHLVICCMSFPPYFLSSYYSIRAISANK